MAFPLLAILLVVRSRPGPQLVYCYPPNPKRPTAGECSNDFDSDSDSNSDDESTNVNGIASLRRPRSYVHKVKPSQDSAQPAIQTDAKIALDTAASDLILGFSEDSLERLLAPGPWSDRKHFDIGLDGIKFVGHPINAHEDGKWSRKEAQKSRVASKLDDRYGDYTNFGITVTEPSSPLPRTTQAQNESFGTSLGTSMNSNAVSVTSSTETTVASQIEMFNLVFVFDTATSAGQEGESEQVYKHVIRKLSKALHYCQKQSGYVGVEAKNITTLKARAKQDRMTEAALQQQILETSELAWAMKEVFDSISSGSIAGIRLNGQAISLHVPTTRDTAVDDNLENVDLSPSCGLLLLEDKGNLLRELSHPDASPLAHFIREHVPTKSLSKLAARMGMSVDETMFLARHLIKWRKARVLEIALRPRNTYLVSPSAPTSDSERLRDLVKEYGRRFPGLPSLPQMLRFLSGGGTGKGIRYGMLIPSRDHQEVYMEILAWLVRYEFVAQLKTYVWLRRVSAQRRSARLSGQKGGRAMEEPNQKRIPISVASLLSPQLRAMNDDDDERLSVSSERTAIPLRSRSVQRNHSPLPTSTTATGPTPASEPEGATEKEGGGGEDDTWNVIVDPLEDSDAVEKVRDAIEDEELAQRLPSLLPYFTGGEALEGMATREGLKRKVCERWAELLVTEGLVTVCRHL